MDLNFLKFAAILMSGVFGFLALIGENRDKKGRFTVWGKAALVGVILSTLVAAWTQTVEVRRAREAERAENEKTQTMLGEIRRGIYPLFPPNLPEFEIELEFNLTNTVFKSYLSNLLVLMAEAQRIGATNFEAKYPNTEIIPHTDENGKVHVGGLSFKSNSLAMPNPTNSIELYQFLRSLRVPTFFLRDQIIRTNLDERPDADLTFEFDVVQSSLDFRVWTIDSDNPTLEIAAQLAMKASETHLGGTIVSLADLDNVQLWVELETLSYDDQLDTNVVAIIDAASIQSFSMTAARKPFFLTHFRRLQAGSFVTFFPTNMLQRDVNLELRTKRRW